MRLADDDNPEPLASRIAAAFGALVHEQVDVTRRFLETEAPDLGLGEGPLVETSVHLVECGAAWLNLTGLEAAARSLRDGLARLEGLRPEQTQEMVAHCKVQLGQVERFAATIHAATFGPLLSAVEPGEPIVGAGPGPRVSAGSGRAHEMIDQGVPDFGPRENLLGLTVEIKSAIVNQNDRIGAIGEVLDETLRSIGAAITESEQARKVLDRTPAAKRGAGHGNSIEERSTALHLKLQEVASSLRTLAYEMNHLRSVQYSLERRARDLDEHLLWEFLDPLDRFVDDLYAAVSHRGAGRQPILTVQTGGVGFEPEIGSILLPLLCRLLESAEPTSTEGTPEIRVTAGRQGLEAWLAVEGYFQFDPATVRMLEDASAGLGGFVSVQGGGLEPMSLRLQFPMARSLRSFLVVEAAGQRVALPWSSVERIHATEDELVSNGSEPYGSVVPLASFLGGLGEATRGVDTQGAPAGHASGRPLAVVRSGGRLAVVAFDRIVWRESARMTALPGGLCPAGEVLGGILTPDADVTLVLNPAALMGAARPAAIGAPGEEARP